MAILLAAALLGGVWALVVPTRGTVRDGCAGAGGRWGDVNDDGAVSIVDAQQLARHSVGLSVANTTAMAARGDVTADGVVSVVDAQQVARHTVALGAATRVNTLVVQVATLPLTPGESQTLAAGTTLALAAAPRDTTGANLTPCAPVTWNSSAPSVATVSANGVVSGLGAGTATITAASGSAAARLEVTVTATVPGPTGITVTASAPGAVSRFFVRIDSGGRATEVVRRVVTTSRALHEQIPLPAGSGYRVRVYAVDAAAQRPDAEPLVGALGVVRQVAVTAGATTMVPVTLVAPTVALGAPDSVAAGQGAQATVTVRAPLRAFPGAGAALACVLRWGSTPFTDGQAVSDARVAAPVTADTVAPCLPAFAPLGAAITLHYQVRIPLAPFSLDDGGTVAPQLLVPSTQRGEPLRRLHVSARRLALVLTRLDPTAAAPLSSNGIPLPPGWLFERDLATTLLHDGTRELPRVLQPLAGRHPDGSLRGVLLQYRANPAVTALQLQVGGARTVADPAPWPIPEGTPQAVTFPQDPAFLLGTGIVGPSLPVAENPNTTFDTQFRAFAEQHWQAVGAQWEQANQYDRAFNHFTFWVRSGEVSYFTRAVALALDYRDRYLAPSGFNPSPHWMALEGVALHYWLTGDPASRTAVLHSAGRSTAAFSPSALALPGGQYTEGRIQARVLVASLLAWELGDTTDDWSGKAAAYAANIMALQRPTGGYAWPNWCDHQSNAMVGLQNDALIKYYERHTATPAVVTTIRRAVDYLYRSSWRPASRAFTYTDVECTGPDDLRPVPDLNMLVVNGFAFVARHTGNRWYAAVADSVAEGATAGAWLGGGKQFNQHYYDSHQYLWYRR